jgi:hypothetical protein
MFTVSRPDTTNEGWNSWPTEKVSHALVRDRRVRGRVEANRIAMLTNASADVAALELAAVIRQLVEGVLKRGEAEELREELVAFALSRVDWLQLAQAQVDAAITEDEAFPVADAAA